MVPRSGYISSLQASYIPAIYILATIRASVTVGGGTRRKETSFSAGQTRYNQVKKDISGSVRKWVRNSDSE